MWAEVGDCSSTFEIYSHVNGLSTHTIDTNYRQEPAGLFVCVACLHV